MTVVEQRFLNHTRIVKAERVAYIEKVVTVPAGQIPREPLSQAQGKAQAQPEVTVSKAEDGAIQTVTVRCTCGREIPLQCEYLDGGDK